MPGEPDGDASSTFRRGWRTSAAARSPSLAAARENARIIREVITRTCGMPELLPPRAARPWRCTACTSTTAASSTARPRNTSLFHGDAEGTMAHGEAWSSSASARHLERACQTGRVLDVKYSPAADAAAGRHAGGPAYSRPSWPAIPVMSRTSSGRRWRSRTCRWRISSFTTRCSPARCTACASAGRRPAQSPVGRATRSSRRYVPDRLAGGEGRRWADGEGLHGRRLTSTAFTARRRSRGSDVLQRGPQTPPAPTAAGAASGGGGASYQCAVAG